MKKISPRRTRAHAATTLAIVLVAAACGGEQNADPPATSAAVPNTTPSTILPPATSHPTTTAPATTTTTVATPPTTTGLSEEEQAKQAVIEAAQNAWHLFNEAKLDPTNDEKVQAALHAFIGEARARVQQVINQYRSDGWKSRTSDLAPASIDVIEDTAQVDLATGTATLDLCVVNSNVLVEVAGNVDGTDRVLDDSVSAFSAVETYTLVNGEWLQSEAVAGESVEGATCAPDM